MTTPPRLAPKIAILGGGLAGLAAARRLAQAGAGVTVFDKGRGVGGRASTRYAEDSRQFDHGAQYFTHRSEAFGAQVEVWQAEGVAALWTPRLAVVECGGDGRRLADPPRPKQRYVGTPSMSALANRLADDVVAAGGTVTASVRVAPLKRTHGRWRLRSEAGDDLGDFAKVLVTAPAPQAAELLTPSPALANAAKSVRMAPCWGVMAGFAERVEPAEGGGFDAAFVNGPTGATPLSWIARDSSKPGRPRGEDRWVLHASGEWSAAQLGLEPQQSADRLLAAFWQATGATPREPAHLVAHRWRFATPENPLEDHSLSDRSLDLYAAGDWCGGPRVEGAFLSGLAAADAILAG